ncbi:MAG: outer membrane beta-barrel protein [Burkholderiaceae bacterium]|jgi:opacity protein-like surface antigen|nr:outer membrane beta-barrel protein [Burkholderiaceae bacterium]
MRSVGGYGQPPRTFEPTLMEITMPRFPVPLAALAAASLLVAAPSTAQQFTIGAGVGQSSFRVDTAGATASDTKDIGIKLYGGAMFNPYLGVEAALFDLGEASGTAAVPGVGQARVSGKARGASLVGVAAYPFGDASVFAKAGVAYVRARSEGGLAGFSASESESSLQPIYGLGASYAFTPQWVGRIEWERIRVRYAADATDNADLVSVGLAYRF